MAKRTELLAFSRKVLVYLPAYNCGRVIISVLDEIPASIWEIADFLVVDNCSTDNTADLLLQANAEQRFPRHVHVVRPPRNLGYSGSQKLAYKLALASPSVERVIMLHGDGQYSPLLLNDYLPLIDSDYGVVYGYRDKRVYRSRDETPLVAYFIIKLMSALESIVTGYRRKEWHGGFVMYSRRFLERVAIDNLTSTPHIDGHLLFTAGVLDEKVLGIPIWKRYKNYPGFGGLARVKYMFDVFRLLIVFRLQKSSVRRTLESPDALEYSVLSEAVVGGEDSGDGS